jgi:hypothetical protein
MKRGRSRRGLYRKLDAGRANQRIAGTASSMIEYRKVDVGRASQRAFLPTPVYREQWQSVYKRLWQVSEGKKPGWAARIFGALFLVSFVIVAFVFFFYGLSSFFGSLSADLVVIMKGSFQMLGAGIGLSALIFAGIYESWLGKRLTEKQVSITMKVALGGVILIFTLPHVIHYAMGSALERKGYSVCDAASRKSPHNPEIVYIRQPLECTKDVEKRFNEKRT